MSKRDPTGGLILQGSFCGHCGLFIPKDMATLDKNGMPYCSNQCRTNELRRAK